MSVHQKMNFNIHSTKKVDHSEYPLQNSDSCSHFFPPSKSKSLRHYYSSMQPKKMISLFLSRLQNNIGRLRLGGVACCCHLSCWVSGSGRSLGRYREQLHRVFNSAAASPASPPPPLTKEAARRLVSAWGAAEDTNTHKAPQPKRGRRTLDHFLKDYFGT